MRQILASIVVQAYALDFGLCQKVIPCEGARTVGFEWFVPITEDGSLKGYRAVILSGKPTPDSVKTLKVVVDGRTLNIAVADDAELTAFADACNACCEQGTPTIAAPAVPDVLYEEVLCANADGDFVIKVFAPALYTGQKVMLGAVTCNGETLDPLPPAEGFATLQAAIDFATANYADFGTFTLASNGNTDNPGSLMVMTSPDCSKASLTMELAKQNFCAPVTFPVTYEWIEKNGKAKEKLPAPRTAANMDELIGQLASDFSDGLLTSTIAGKLNYYGTGVPKKLYAANGSTAVATFTAGACTA